MLFCIPLPRRTIGTACVCALVKALAEPFRRIVPGTLAKCRQLSWTEGVPSASPRVWPTSPLGLLDSEATAVLASKTVSGSKWEKWRACHQCCSWKAVTCAAQQAQPGRQNVPGTNAPTSYNDSCLSFGSLHSINYMPTYYCVKTPLWWVQYSLCIIAGILNWRKTYQGSLQATGEEDFTTSCCVVLRWTCHAGIHHALPALPDLAITASLWQVEILYFIQMSLLPMRLVWGSSQQGAALQHAYKLFS